MVIVCYLRKITYIFANIKVKNMNMLKRYKLDTTANSSENLVKEEIHVLSGEGGDICFTRNGAFYNKSLVVKQGTKVLTLNKDYVYCFFWQDATTKLGNPVSVAIQIKNNNLIGKITLTYQVVGGEYQTRYTEMDTHIHKMSINETRNVFWDEVLEIPTAFIPTRHLHRAADIYGIQALVQAVYALKEVVANSSVLKLKSVYDRFLKLKNYVEQNLNSIDTYKHELNLILETIKANNGNSSITLMQIETLFDQKYDALIANLVTDLNKSKGSFTEKLTTTNASITSLSLKVEELINSNAVLSATVNQLKANENDTVETMVTTVTNKLKADNTEVTNKVNKLSDKVDTFDDRITREVSSLSGFLESAKTGLKADIAELGRNIIDNYYTPNKVSVDKLRVDLSKLAETIDNNFSVLNDETTRREARLNATIVRLEDRLRQLEQRVETLSLRGNN